MVATRQARAAASASAARAARLFESLDLGVLSVVASFVYPEELVELGVALGKDRGAELLGSTATVDAVLLKARWRVEVRKIFRSKSAKYAGGYCPAKSLIDDAARTASLGAMVKALHDWQLALNTSRWERAKAEARADEVAEAEQFGWDQSPGHRGAGLPEEHLWVKESTSLVTTKPRLLT